MATQFYIYTDTNDNAVNLTLLQQEIITAGLTTINYINTYKPTIEIVFSTVLSGPEITTLNGVVTAHNGLDTFADISIESNGLLNTTYILNSTQTANRTLTLPDATTTIVGTDIAQTLSNKTLVSPIINGNVTFEEATNNLILSVADQTVISPTITIPDLTGSGGDIIISTAIQTLINKTLIFPVINGITDASGNKLLDFTSTANALNQIVIANSITGVNSRLGAAGESTRGVTIHDSNGIDMLILSPLSASSVNQFTINTTTTGTNPNITASGSDSIIGMRFISKGQNSYISIGSTSGISPGELRLEDNSGGQSLAMRPAGATTTHTLTFPASQGGPNQVLQNNGTGILSWATSGDVSGPASSLNLELAVYNGTGGKTVKGAGVRHYGALGTNPVTPPPQAGDQYYNTVINHDMRYDGTRSKWLSVAVLSEGCGRNGNVTAGTYYRRFNGMKLSSTTGAHIAKGTIIRIGYTTSTAVTHTFGIRVNGTNISLLDSGGAASAFNDTVNNDFNAGNMSMLNLNGSSTTVNLQATIYYKLRP